MADFSKTGLRRGFGTVSANAETGNQPSSANKIARRVVLRCKRRTALTKSPFVPSPGGMEEAALQ